MPTPAKQNVPSLSEVLGNTESEETSPNEETSPPEIEKNEEVKPVKSIKAMRVQAQLDRTDKQPNDYAPPAGDTNVERDEWAKPLYKNLAEEATRRP